jgi:hypothetical protein
MRDSNVSPSWDLFVPDTGDSTPDLCSTLDLLRLRDEAEEREKGLVHPFIMTRSSSQPRLAADDDDGEEDEELEADELLDDEREGCCFFTPVSPSELRSKNGSLVLF